jgi:perosamine synthetase
VGTGDEVIVPSFTFIATANAPLFVGARPVFADIDPVTGGLDPADVQERVTPRTRCIIPVHYGGCPCRIAELREVADDNGLLLFEDAAEAFGAGVRGRRIVTTGEGGAVLTGSRELAERLKLLRSHGRLETADYFSSCGAMDYVTLGYNFRMSSITAALGTAQLAKADRLIALRKAKAACYGRKLRAEVPGVFLREPPDGFDSVHQLYSIEVPRRDELMAYLEGEEIMTKIYFPPVHQTHFYRNVLGCRTVLPATEEVAGRILSLPFHAGITEGEMDEVTGAIRAFFERGSP